MNKNTRFWLVLAAVVVLVTLVVGGAGGDGPPYDPDSVIPDGARGIVEILEELGVDVATQSSTTRPDDTAALMLQDRLSEEDTFALTNWVRDGGVLVVADVGSSFSRPPVGPLSFGIGTTDLDQGFCSIDALAEVQNLEVPGGLLLDAGVDDNCFRSGGVGSFVVSTPEGDGTVVTVGGPGIFTNAAIDEADAAVLAVALLAPQPDRAQVTFVRPSTVTLGEGAVSLGDLLAPRVTNSIYQLLAAFLLYALFRMRRLGGVVAEPVPVVIEGSELVLQSGVLSQRAKDPTSAGDILRHDFLVRAHRALGVPVAGPIQRGAAPSDLLTDLIASRSDAASDQIVATFTSAIDTEEKLLAMARELNTLEESLNA